MSLGGSSSTHGNPKPGRPLRDSLAFLLCPFPLRVSLSIVTRAGCPHQPIPVSPLPNPLTCGAREGKPPISFLPIPPPKKSQNQNLSLDLNLIHILQAIQPVILVPLDHFSVFFLFFPLPHLCLSSSTCFWWFYFSFLVFFWFLFFEFIFVLVSFPLLLPSPPPRF